MYSGKIDGGEAGVGRDASPPNDRRRTRGTHRQSDMDLLDARSEQLRPLKVPQSVVRDWAGQLLVAASVPNARVDCPQPQFPVCNIEQLLVSNFA